MANGAVCREPCFEVIRICRRIELADVAGSTSSGCARKLAVDVATSARDGGVQSRERERRLVVIEHRSRPGDGGVARNASGGKASADMVWIRRGIELGHMAGSTVSWSAGELSISVAVGARNRIVSTSEREGRLAVI